MKKLIIFSNQHGASVAIDPARIEQVVDFNGEGKMTQIRFSGGVREHDVYVPEPMKQVLSRLMDEA